MLAVPVADSPGGRQADTQVVPDNQVDRLDKASGKASVLGNHRHKAAGKESFPEVARLGLPVYWYR